ncbi:MAG: hypothetical protein AAF995_09635 [Planctomycetota bacterium]
MPFTGQADAAIDDKHRLALPAKFRNRWNPERDGKTWFAVPWAPDACLRLYTERMFEDLFLAGRRSPSLTPSPTRARLDGALFSATEQLDVDSNHRVRFQAWQVEKLKLPREVVVIGAGDRLEVRARENWGQAFDDLLEDLPRLAELLAQEENAPRV